VSVTVRGSVRRRLLLTLLGGVMLVWLAAAAVTAWETRAEMQELLDAHLAQSASLLMAQIGHDFDEIEREYAQPLHKYAHRVGFQVWEDGRTLLPHSADAPATPLSDVREGFSDASVNGEAWRVFSVWDARREYLVQVGEAFEAREHLAREVLEKLVQPLLFAIPLLGLLIWVAVGAALRPIGRIGAALAQRDPNYLAPVDGVVPGEIAPMVERLNGLLDRVRDSLDAERRFTGEAAHELRTPLAALKTQLQVAQGAASATEREHAIAQALAAGARATRLIEQLLTLARLDHDGGQQGVEAVDLHAIAAQALAECAPSAAARHIALSLAGETGTTVKGHAGLLGILLRNLVDNAVRYSPDGTEVEVRVATESGRATLDVIDQGPGIPAEERDNVLRRFHRLAGEAIPGSGLGLSIVARIAELHRARLELLEGPSGKGLRVRVTL
jgi:two-component system sensor histidine kinase QseC